MCFVCSRRSRQAKKVDVMKRITVVVLVLAMALSLCACKSSDYKEALELYEDERYEQARGIFVELGDYKNSGEMVNQCDYQLALVHMEDGEYEEAKAIFVKLDGFEDSAEKIVECDYQMALDALDNGEYQQARELFLELGDYEDSAENAMIAAQYMLIKYIEPKGELVERSDDNSNGTVLKVEGNRLVVAYLYKTTGLINIDMRIGTVLEPGEKQAILTGTDKLSTYAAHYTASASCNWDIENYTKDGEMEWAEFEISGKTAQGTAYPQENAWLDLFLTTGVSNISKHIEKVLGESGLGLTMKDIGFVNY